MKLALGTAQWGLKYGISNVHGIITDKELKTILSIEKNNIRLFDNCLLCYC